ncbi:MAG: diacylglyceryl transferase [Bacteroidetes bacterium]|nr:MAG: diacylglyceryl transferase [Bacteroidota bacterium]
MYPNLYYFLKEVFGFEPWAWTKFVNSFGFFVAISFILAAVVLTNEFKRKERAGLVFPKEETILVGKPASMLELLLNAIFGFIVGYKLFGIFQNQSDISPQEFIFSSRGNWLGGIGMGVLFGILKFREKNKQKLDKPEERKIRVWPHERVGNMAILAVIFGFLGAKLFDNLENWDRFIKDPIGNLLSPSGLTFYGGLICAGIAIIIYSKRKNIGIRHLFDSFAPALMIAYAVGRIGCQVSGDGDWGVRNHAYVTGEDGKAVLKSQSNTRPLMSMDPNEGEDTTKHYSVNSPSFLPAWTVAYTYPHNVNDQGIRLKDCEGDHCAVLASPVFPTPFYETVVCLVLFVVLMLLRKRVTIPGQIFGIYLVMNGVERFFIEKIRVNTRYNIFGFHPTQAEIISVILAISGIALFFWAKSKSKKIKTAQA